MVTNIKMRTGFRRAASVGTMALVMASMIAPTLASAQERGDRGGGRGEARVGQQEFRSRGERMQDLQQRQQSTPAPAPAPVQAPPQRQYSPQSNGQVRQAQPAGQAQQRQYGQRRQDGERPNGPRQPNQRAYGDRQAVPNQGDRAPGNWQQRNDDRTGTRDARAEQWRNQRTDNTRGTDYRNQRDDRNRWQEGRRNSDNREGWRGGNASRNDRGDRRGWDRGWRSNSRYDWSSYRASNRGIYRPGRYYSPNNNYSYTRLGIGYTLGSLFYGQNYWINDPWSYRLPEAEDGYRWVRYYNDVLLVDTYSGEVVDVIYDFFW